MGQPCARCCAAGRWAASPGAQEAAGRRRNVAQWGLCCHRSGRLPAAGVSPGAPAARLAVAPPAQWRRHRWGVLARYAVIGVPLVLGLLAWRGASYWEYSEGVYALDPRRYP